MLVGSETADRQTEWNMKHKQMFKRGKGEKGRRHRLNTTFTVCGQVKTQKELRFSWPGLLVKATQPYSGTFHATEPALFFS